LFGHDKKKPLEPFTVKDFNITVTGLTCTKDANFDLKGNPTRPTFTLSSKKRTSPEIKYTTISPLSTPLAVPGCPIKILLINFFITLKILFMKRVMKNKNMMIIAVIAMLTLGTATVVSATPLNDEPVEIKYLGSVKNQPIFQLNLSTGNEKAEYIVTIKDEFGVELYSERIKGGNVTRKYRIDTDEVSLSGISFEVLNKQTAETSVYKVNSTTRTLQDVSIAKS